MEQIVTITSQGQLTIPRAMRDAFGIRGATKAIVQKKGNIIVVEPKNDFWSLAGSLSSDAKLSDKELKKARASFEKRWASHE